MKDGTSKFDVIGSKRFHPLIPEVRPLPFQKIHIHLSFILRADFPTIRTFERTAQQRIRHAAHVDFTRLSAALHLCSRVHRIPPNIVRINTHTLPLIRQARFTIC